MADITDDIKARLGIEELVSQYVQLKRAGRNLKGLCPFHSEKTPSFVVSPEKQICHCFGCNKGGDIFAFIEEVEGVNFIEALQILADKVGIKVDSKKLPKQTDKSEKDAYFQAHELACAFFEKQLHGTADGAKVLQYLYKRGLKDETIKEFRLGFAPDKYDELYPYLLKKGLTQQVLMKSGLISSKNIGSDSIYDKYRARLIFPIFDYLGKVCGFGGRALKADQAPKYLNSPENLIYNKSKVLYGLYHGKKSIKELDQVVFVEGYFDVILPFQDGIQNIVATSGTGLSNDQVKMVKRLANNVVTCFDNDDAGFEATKRAYFIFQNFGLNVRTISQTSGKDPADLVVEESGSFRKLVDSSGDFITFFMEKLLGRFDITSYSGRQKVLDELLPCYKVMSPAVRDFFVRQLAAKLNMNEKYLYEEMNVYQLPLDHPARLSRNEDVDVADAKDLKMSVHALILAMVLEYPVLFQKIVDLLHFEDFENEDKSVYKALTDQYNSLRENFNGWDFEDGFLSGIKAKIGVFILYAEERYKNFSEDALVLELEKLVDKTKKDRKTQKLNQIQLSIVEAEKLQDKDKLKELLEEQRGLLNC